MQARRYLCLAALPMAAAYVAPAARAMRHHAARARAPALAESGDADTGFFRNPFQQAQVPDDQQPVAELAALKAAPFYAWAEGAGPDAGAAYRFKLGLLYAAVFAAISIPISSVTYSWNDPAQLLLTATIGTSGAMLPFALRLRVGWGYVSRRLRQRFTYFEEQDESGASVSGSTVQKDRAAIMRDRLVEKEEVAPAIERLDASLLALLASLVLGIVALDGLALSLGEDGPMVMRSLSGDEARDYTNRLRSDDEFAAREQARARQRSGTQEALQPAYCSSRYYKILAGGNGQGGVGCGQ